MHGERRCAVTRLNAPVSAKETLVQHTANLARESNARVLKNIVQWLSVQLCVEVGRRKGEGVFLSLSRLFVSLCVLSLFFRFSFAFSGIYLEATSAIQGRSRSGCVARHCSGKGTLLTYDCL